MKAIVTRFAPSPTGTLHIGGVRTALFNYVYAKQNNGKFLIRIEDTDTERSTKEYEKNILDNLTSIGLKPDEDPINQSERNEIYLKAAEKIFQSGNAYWCDCSQEELEEMRKAQIAAGKKPMYDGRSRNLGLEKSDKTVLRLATPEDGEIIVNDLIRGEIKFNNNELDDLILLRSDGSPTYHLCNVVDDYEQKVTTVIRGEDHLTNTVKQLLVYQALNWVTPEFAHIPLIHNERGEKLSKRDGKSSLLDFKQEGFLPDAMLNYLARLGWSYKDEEFFNLNQAISWFTLDGIGKSPSRFDIKKLLNISKKHLISKPADEIHKLLLQYIKIYKVQHHKNLKNY